jgi:hypothetical protein
VEEIAIEQVVKHEEHQGSKSIIERKQDNSQQAQGEALTDSKKPSYEPNEPLEKLEQEEQLVLDRDDDMALRVSVEDVIARSPLSAV